MLHDFNQAKTQCLSYVLRVKMKAVRPAHNASSFSILSSSYTILLSFLITLFIFRAQSRALTPSSLSLTSPTNLTKFWSYRHCVSDPTWNPQTLFIASSCETALVAANDDIEIWGRYPGTFIYQAGARSTASFPGARSPLAIPKRYVSGNCVVAIVMMKMFERSSIGQFPGLPDSLIGKWRSRDLSTWKGLIEPAEYVRATCENGCGYAVVGRDHGIGVAIWGVGSIWDRYTRDIASLSEGGEVLRFGNSSAGDVGNGGLSEMER